MKIYLSVLCLIPLFTSVAASQTVGFYVQTDYVTLPGGDPLNISTANNDGRNVVIYGGMTNNLALLETLASDFNAGSTAQNRIDAISNLHANTAAVTWLGDPIPFAGAGWSDFFDWRGERNGTAGHFPVLLVTTQPIDQLSESSFVGLIYSSAAIVELVTNNVSMTNSGPDAFGQSWFDQTLIGSRQSPLELHSAIPEPRVYAAIFGLAALGFVVWRRRVRR